MEQVKHRSRRTHALLDHAAIGEVNGTTIALTVSSAPIAKMISDDSNLSVLREALTAVVGGGWQITVTADGGAGSGAPRLPVPPAAEPEESRTSQRPATSNRAAASPRSAKPADVGRSQSRPPVDDGVDEDSDEIEGSGGGDHEAAAIQLLQNSLGARPLDG
jgi:DNA polymerase-3 subunit gamma/tau